MAKRKLAENGTETWKVIDMARRNNAAHERLKGLLAEAGLVLSTEKPVPRKRLSRAGGGACGPTCSWPISWAGSLQVSAR